jgi:ATP-binding cassette subfamily B protein
MFDLDEVTGRHLDWSLFRRFLRLIRPYRLSATVAMALLPLATAARLVQPFLIKVAIDRYIVPGQLTGLGGVVLLFLAAACTESLLGFWQGYLAQGVGQKITADLRSRGFRHLLRLPVRYFDRHPSGRLVTRLTSDVENIGELFGSGVAAAFGEVFSLVFVVTAMLWLSPSLTLVAFALLPLLGLILVLFRHRMRQAMRQVRARLAELNGYLAERIAGIGTVRLFGQENRTLEEFDGLQEVYRISSFAAIRWDVFLFSALETLSALAIAGILWRGGMSVLEGVATFGTLVAFLEYVQRFFAPLRKLSGHYSLLQASNASLERIFELLDQPSEACGTKAPAKGRGGVRFEGVCFSYDGSDPVLSDIDLTIAPGEMVGLVGDTGSGKTTLGRLLLRFYDPTKGRILLDDVDLGEIDPTEVRRRIGWVSQEPFLFAGTVRDNVDPLLRFADEELLELLEKCGAWKVVERLGGLQGRLEERGRNLSAGERQLLCLVRTLAVNPSVLLFDEATSRLDAATEAVVQQQMERLHHGRTVLVIAHRLRSVQHADRIVLLHRGVVREIGTHAQLLAQNGLYARLWRLQHLDVNGMSVAQPG